MATFWERAAHSVFPYVLFVMFIFSFGCLPFRFWGREFGSDSEFLVIAFNLLLERSEPKFRG